MGDITNGVAPQNPHERRAQALAEITKMQEDLLAANKQIAEMERLRQEQVRDLQYQANHWQDRCAMAEEERGAYRAQAMLYQRKLVELATQMSDIGMLTARAQKVMDSVQCLLGGDDPNHGQAEQESAREVVNGLPAPPEDVQAKMLSHLGNILEQVESARGQHVATESAVADGERPALARESNSR